MIQKIRKQIETDIMVMMDISIALIVVFFIACHLGFLYGINIAAYLSISYVAWVGKKSQFSFIILIFY